jgi:hypothetical protein
VTEIPDNSHKDLREVINQEKAKEKRPQHQKYQKKHYTEDGQEREYVPKVRKEYTEEEKAEYRAKKAAEK